MQPFWTIIQQEETISVGIIFRIVGAVADFVSLPSPDFTIFSTTTTKKPNSMAIHSAVEIPGPARSVCRPFPFFSKLSVRHQYSLPLVWSGDAALLVQTSWPAGGSGSRETGALGTEAGGVTGLPSTSVV